MNNKIIKIAAIAFAVIIVIAGAWWVYTTFILRNGNDKSAAEIYTCPMHPQVISDRPGVCPICGMDLVKKSELQIIEHLENDSTLAGLNAVKLSPSQQVLANVQTERVKTMQFTGEKTFNGYVKINEKNFAHISTAVSGKIVNMFVNFEGQYVQKGQAVLEIYSPELVSTQREYLLAINNLNDVKKSGNQIATEQAVSLVDAARRRLLLFEMTKGQIDELEKTRDIRTTVKQYSRFSGVITKKYVHVGHWAMAGEDIYDVADLSTIWVIANIYENEVQYIKNGQNVEISSGSYPGETFNAKINFIEPIFDAASRTQQVRIDVSNRNNKLKPDMYVKIKINTFYNQLIAVPKNSVIRKGEHDIVYVEKEKGVYIPKMVKVAFEQDGYYAISEGISEGDVVVVSGGFLIDSESQIQAGMTYGHEQHTGSNPKKEEDLKINPDQDIMKDMEKKKSEEHKH
ncbi:MAG TPA: efflux RND transporter periplasmic adaptor subunit [Ignavibacteria bacterium]|jgi:Cu(I)/Ag(I) efflux system membrane fusion protein